LHKKFIVLVQFFYYYFKKYFFPKKRLLSFLIQKFPGGISSLKLGMSNKQVDETEGLSSTFCVCKM